MFYNETKISEFIVDKTWIKVGSELIWIWVVIDYESKGIIATTISKERNMFLVECFLSNVIKEYD